MINKGQLLLLILLVAFFVCAVSGQKKKTLTEDELFPAILSTIVGTTSRLELERHRPNRTLSSLIQVGRGEEANNEAHEDLSNSSDSQTETKSAVMSKLKQDAIIQRLWGGDCQLDDWVRCNNITTFGGDYYVDDKLEHFEMECTTFKWVCMINGWTVNRCHLLCMSSCNRDLLVTNKYDKMVRHEGMCDPVSSQG